MYRIEYVEQHYVTEDRRRYRVVHSVDGTSTGTQYELMTLPQAMTFAFGRAGKLSVIQGSEPMYVEFGNATYKITVERLPATGPVRGEAQVCG